MKQIIDIEAILKERQQRKQKRMLNLVSFVVWVLSVWVILKWYDWKLLVILILFVWANNMMIEARNLNRK
jgi:hypothetical protein